jgi:transcriptional regulator with XRE-family HTH domain
MTTPGSPAGSPTVRRRRLAAELRQIREGSGQKLENVATAMKWSTSRLSRYELAKGAMRPRDVALLLDHYQITSPRRDQLLALAEEAAQKGWWEDFSDVSSPEFLEFVGLEAEATSIAVWHTEVVTGLLQTERYTRAIVRDYYRQVEPTAPAILERRVQFRMQRQRVLSRDAPFELVVVLDESILRRKIGDESVMYEQLLRLAEVDEKKVILRVLPLSGRHPVIADSFVVFRFGEQDDAILHDVVATEGLTTDFYVEGQQETHMHRMVFDIILDASLNQGQSKELILSTAQTLWA